MELIDVFNHYDSNFHGRICRIETNYKALTNVQIKFDHLDLPHLIGLHKGYSLTATEFIQKVQANTLTLKDLHQLNNGKDIVHRVRLYPILEEIFYNGIPVECVVEKDIRPNTMQLSLAILTDKGRHTIVLGIRLGKDGYYHPVTLHEALTRKYQSVRKSRIINVTFI